MKRWYYAVVVEGAGWFNLALKATDEQDARDVLTRQFPHASIHSLTR